MSATVLLSTLLLIPGLLAAGDAVTPGTLDLGRYTLAWSDEFEGSALDPAKWDAPAMERQKASRWVPALVRVADGCLHLDIRLTNDPRLRYDCGAVRTANTHGVTRFSMREGYVEARIRLPRHLDADYWGAFWIMAGRINDDQTDTRLGTEIDIMESFNLGPRHHHAATMHWGGYGRNHNSVRIDAGERKELRDGAFHTFGLRWGRDAYTFYVDGGQVCQTDMQGLGSRKDGQIKSQGVCSEPGYLKLSVEADQWPGASPKWEADMPKEDEMAIDWVRAYREK